MPKPKAPAPTSLRTRVRLDFTITHDKPIAMFSVLDMAEGAIRAADADRPDVYIEPGARMIVSRRRAYRQDSEAHDGKRVPSQRKGGK